jgi:hypothetical protein
VWRAVLHGTITDLPPRSELERFRGSPVANKHRLEVADRRCPSASVARIERSAIRVVDTKRKIPFSLTLMRGTLANGSNADVKCSSGAFQLVTLTDCISSLERGIGKRPGARVGQALISTPNPSHSSSARPKAVPPMRLPSPRSRNAPGRSPMQDVSAPERVLA